MCYLAEEYVLKEHSMHSDIVKHVDLCVATDHELRLKETNQIK